MKNNRTLLTFATLFWTFAVCTVAYAQRTDPLDQFSPLRAQTLASYHESGLSGDRTEVPSLVHSLQTHNATDVRKTLLMTLARLGAVDALPAVDDIVRSERGSETHIDSFARAARAYLLAQTEPTPHERSARFFRELGETPNQLNAALQKHVDAVRSRSETWVSTFPFYEADAMEDLADLVYRGPTDEFLADPLVSQVNFNLWFDAQIKVEMARLTPEQQRQTLVDRLAQSRRYDSDEWHEAQILIDLGHEQAVQVVTAKLQEMEGDSKSYALMGFQSLFRVLYACEDSTHSSPVWKHFQEHPNRKLKEIANIVRFEPTNNAPGVTVYGY